jgi:hypothetical protein
MESKDRTARATEAGKLHEGKDLEEQNLLILQAQTEILENISAIQESVRNAVIKREWTDFEALLGAMNRYSEEFQTLETERAAIFSDLSGDTGKNGAFYSMVSRLPAEQRKTMSDMYRNLKLRALRVRVANESLVTYLDEAKTTAGSFMEAAFPDRKTRLYSRWGTRISADMRSMVVNQSL